MYDDFDSDCKSLLKQLGKWTMEVRRLWISGAEIIKTKQLKSTIHEWYISEIWMDNI